MSNLIILQDNIIPTGTSPIYDQGYNEIGKVQYHFFSLRGKIEIFDAEDNLVSFGQSKLLTFLPKWHVFDSNEQPIGEIQRKFSIFKKTYNYIDSNKNSYFIKGSILDRKFKVYDSKEQLVLDVSNLSGIISLRPYTFAIEILSDKFSKWEAVSVVQGIRSLVKLENESNQRNVNH